MPASLALLGGREDRARLHLGDLGIHDAEAAAAEAEHRVGLAQALDLALELARTRCPSCSASSSDLLVLVRQELVQRRVERADRHRQAVHRPEDADEVFLLIAARPWPAPRGAPRPYRRRSSRARRRCGRLRRTCARCGTGRCPRRRSRAPPRRRAAYRRWCARRSCGTRRPSAISVWKSLAQLGVLRFELPGEHLAGRAVERDPVALARPSVPLTRERSRAVVDTQLARAGDTGLAHAARHDGGVRGHAAARSQHRLGRDHAVEVFGRGLDAHQDHLLAGLGQLLGLVGVEDDLAAGRAGRGRQATRSAPAPWPWPRE